jgi:hypothetical protein
VFTAICTALSTAIWVAVFITSIARDRAARERRRRRAKLIRAGLAVPPGWDRP